MVQAKRLKRRIRMLRNRLVARFFDTRYGRELVVSTIGSRILTMTADCGDHVMTFSPHDYIGRKVFRKGHFERDHVDRLLRILGDRGIAVGGSALLELGGNIGTQTVYFALAGVFSRIVSVEPDPRNVALLRANILANDLQALVTTVHCAAGETDGEIDFFLHQNNHGKSSATRQSPSDRQITVAVRAVGPILAQAGVSAEAVGLIWMDIEGYEPVACRSMEMLLARRVPLYMEFSPTFYGPAAARDFVRHLSGFYENCLVFSGEEHVEMKVAKLPVDEDQFDILLLP